MIGAVEIALAAISAILAGCVGALVHAMLAGGKVEERLHWCEQRFDAHSRKLDRLEGDQDRYWRIACDGHNGLFDRIEALERQLRLPARDARGRFASHAGKTEGPVSNWQKNYEAALKGP